VGVTAGGVGVPTAASRIAGGSTGGAVTAVDGVIGVGCGAVGGGEGKRVSPEAVMRGSGAAPPPGSGVRLTAKNAMPPSAAAASKTAMSQTATLLLRRIPSSRGSMSLTLSSAPKFRVLP
jgi:hypothetical protein